MARKQTQRVVRALTAAALAVAASAAVAAQAGAEPPRPSPVGAHQHYLEVPGAPGEVVVGPNSCTRGGSRQFDEFHHNVHAGPSPITGRGCP